jgi:hypothetical protein
VILLDRPVRPADLTPVEAREAGGVPVTVKTPAYEISDIRFFADQGGSLHVTGKLKNTSQRDFRNPQVYVAIYDRVLNQVALKPTRLTGVGAVLFRDATGDFDAQFPRFTFTLAGYRVFMLIP